MTIIVRPTKTGGGTGFVPGNDVLAEEFNGDADTIYGDYNGNIKNANCAADMGLEGTKIADAPAGIPTTKINDKAVTGAKIPNDVSVDANRAITIDHIKLNSIPITRLKNVVIETIAFSRNFGVGVNPILAFPHKYTVGANYEFKVILQAQDVATQLFTGHTVNVTPVTAIPIATKEVIGTYLDSIVFSGNTLSGNIVFVSIDRT